MLIDSQSHGHAFFQVMKTSPDFNSTMCMQCFANVLFNKIGVLVKLNSVEVMQRLILVTSMQVQTV